MQTILETKTGKLIQGDNLEVMDNFQEEYFDNCISDFPYNLSFMSKKWDTQKNFYNWCYKRAEKLYKIIKKGGYVMIFGHHKSNHRMKCAFEDAGFKIVEEIDWIYSTGFPKNQDIGKMFLKQIERQIKKQGVMKINDNKNNVNKVNIKWIKTTQEQNIQEHNIDLEYMKIIVKQISDNKFLIPEEIKEFMGLKTSGLKPAKEIITVFQKAHDENYCHNIIKHGCSAMYIEKCRIPYKDENDLSIVKAKCNFTDNSKSIGFGTANSLYGTGITPLDIARNCVKENGRFPANIMFDSNMGEVLDSQSGITKSGKVTKNKDSYEGESNTGFLRGITTMSNQHGDSGGVSRFF